jgi:hypothetical protein
MAAHVFACYAWVGTLALYNFASDRADQSSERTSEHFDEDEWYWRFLAPAAPVTVPCLLGLAVVMTVASPVERIPVSATLILLSLYLIPFALVYKTLSWRLRPRDNPPLERTAAAV